MRGPAAKALLVAGLVAGLAGCQLVDRQENLQPTDTDPSAAEAEELLGNPDEDFPSTLAGLRAFAGPEALTWQDEPVLVDMTVWLTPSGMWERLRATYVAADADRMMTVRADPDRLRVERPRLEGLGLLELPDAAVAELPPVPEGLLEPADLGAAAADALASCDAGGQPVVAVVYATGAPAAWDGSTWTTPPAWRSTVITETAGVAVDPTSGTPLAPLTCVDPVLPEE
ncbi:hypothetical protein [Euzebya rosea]|uniref:hypothetical protein n=1 Tax=Euzebya rosea TaxID=2052804 RepID=UPI000D3E4FBA|nr:hypothetical protein [Euzebya rosea]